MPTSREDRWFVRYPFFFNLIRPPQLPCCRIYPAVQAFFMLLRRRRAGPEPPYLSPQGQGRLLRSQYLLENSPLSFLTVNDVWVVMVWTSVSLVVESSLSE